MNKKYIVCWVEKSMQKQQTRAVMTDGAEDKLLHWNNPAKEITTDYYEVFEDESSAANLLRATEAYQKLLKGEKTYSANLCLILESSDYTTSKKQQ